MRAAIFDCEFTSRHVDLTGATIVGLPDDMEDESRIIVEKDGVQYTLMSIESMERNIIEMPAVSVGGVR